MTEPRSVDGLRQTVRILLTPSITKIANSSVSKPLMTSAELKRRRFPASMASTLGR